VNIVKVTSEGIHYISQSGQQTFLDFNDCNENWLLYRKKTDLLNDEQLLTLRKKDKTIGQRDISDKQKFIEFFTRPFTRFVFSIPEQEEAYKELRDSIREFGWTTFDLS